MPRFQISTEAEEDIDEIVAYTNSTWGWRQTDQYLAKLEDGFDLLAHNSSIGAFATRSSRACADLRSASMLCFICQSLTER